MPEFFRPDPFGGIVESDRSGAAWLNTVEMTAGRGSYVSFHLVVKDATNANCRLSVQLPLAPDVYREWFHFNTPDRKYYPDALIPTPSSFDFRISDLKNGVTGQTAAAFWVDVWVPASAEPKIYRGKAILSSGNEQKVIHIALNVLRASVPDEDAVVLDNNSYGAFWLIGQYPKTLTGFRDEHSDANAGDEAKLISLIQAYHRIFYDHRGTFHQLGYGHAGKVGPEFAPKLAGTGNRKHVEDWSLFDQHYGPLFDGTAFKDSRRGPRPVPYVYLPVNPEWPASFLWWGEPGYEAEFVNVLSEMERHFREKGWTRTRFEIFFNHKKRYKGFPWDGDEIRFERDNEYLKSYHRMLERAVPRNSPVQFVMRADTSWTMAQQFRELEGVINFWVAGEGELSWYPDAANKLKQHGDILWTYGGTPPVQNVSSAITLNPLRSWITNVDGFVRWETVDPGPDPWFKLGGGDLTLVYPGERFGVIGPLASIRLKLQRNCLQDLALLNSMAKPDSLRNIQEAVVSRFNRTSLADWKNANPNLPAKPILEWDNADFEETLRPFEARFSNLDASSWLRVHDFVVEQAREMP